MKKLKKRRKFDAFTLIELIAVMVILAVILSITVPIISGIIRPATISAFKSDAKLLLRSLNLELSQNADLDVANITVENIDEILQLSSQNYKAVNVEAIDSGTTLNSFAIRIEGQGKWDGLYACGTYQNMRVTDEWFRCSGDIESPLMTILGENPHIIYIGDVYVDAGAIAIDNLDGDMTSKITTEGIVNINVPGTYTITYRAIDRNDNMAFITRDVVVLDNILPVITFNPNGNTTYAKTRDTTINIVDDSPLLGSSLKYVWTTSNTQPDISAFVNTFTVGQSINTPVGVSGSYYLWTTATDISGNQTYAVSNIFNLDNAAPVIQLKGTNVTIDAGTSYTDAGATATDNISSSVAVSASGTVNPNVVGEYQITYNAVDATGNAAIPVVRIVIVRDITAPQITITGNNPHYVTLGTSYSDAGATATDDRDGNVTSRIQVTGTVNVNFAGTYTVTYTVSDTAGNPSVRTRQVVVQGKTQYRYRTSSTSTSCSTCYSTCYSYTTGTASYSCSSGSLSGSSCVSSYGVYSTFHATYTCYNGSWTWSSHYCTGNCSAPCSNGSGANGSFSGGSCPSGSCTSGSTSCSNYWSGTCYTTSSANVTYICPGGYSGGGSSSSCSQAYSCNPYSCYCSSSTVWSNWSSWSTTPVTANGTTQVETRTCTTYPCSAS